LAFSFFLLLVLRPPAPALFPYTTLFRSRSRGTRPPGGGSPVPAGDHPSGGQGRSLGRILRRPCDGSLTPCPRRSIPRPRPSRSSDRKSTRLNSSHVKISYAVFCLKKKIK